MNILVVQSAKIGDMVCTTPLFRAIKQSLPGAKLYVMGNATNKAVVEGNPHIAEYIVQPKNNSAVRSILKEKDVDVVICTSPNPSVLLQALMAGVSEIIVPKIEGGWSPYATKIYRFFSLFATRVPVRFGHYVPGEYLRLLEPLGVHATNTDKELVYSEAARARAGKILQEAGVDKGSNFLVGVAPGVGNGVKTWGAKRFAEVAISLSEKYNATIVIIGGPADHEATASFRAALPAHVPVVDVAQKLSMDELKALVAQLHLFVSVDTGPIYIAEAFGIPTVDIVGPMDEREQPPQGSLHKSVVPPGRAASVLHIFNTSVVDVDEATRQAHSITPAMVLAAIEDLMAQNKALFAKHTSVV